jgi:hypothetical protein
MNLWKDGIMQSSELLTAFLRLGELAAKSWQALARFY